MRGRAARDLVEVSIKNVYPAARKRGAGRSSHRSSSAAERVGRTVNHARRGAPGRAGRRQGAQTNPRARYENPSRRSSCASTTRPTSGSTRSCAGRSGCSCRDVRRAASRPTAVWRRAPPAVLDETPSNLQQFVCEFFTQPDLVRRSSAGFRSRRVRFRRRRRSRTSSSRSSRRPAADSRSTKFGRATSGY